MRIEDMINDALKRNSKEDKEFSSTGEAIDNLTEFLNQTNDIKVGDVVERNKFGRCVHKFPTDDQVAICLEKFEDRIASKDGEMTDMLMAVALEKNTISTYRVDSRYYQKAGKARNIFKFKKK